MNQEKITLTRNELKYIAESLAVQKVHEIMKSKSRLNEVLVNWDNDEELKDNGILSQEDIVAKLEEPEFDGSEFDGSSSSSEWSSSSSSEDEVIWGSEPQEYSSSEDDDWLNDDSEENILPGSEPEDNYYDGSSE